MAKATGVKAEWGGVSQCGAPEVPVAAAAGLKPAMVEGSFFITAAKR